MKLFSSLNTIRTTQRNTMPYLESLEDQDIVLAVGNAQERGAVITAKQLLLEPIGAPATVRRRLDRLVDLGVVEKRRSTEDNRCMELRLTKAVLKAQKKLATAVERSAA